MGNEREIRMIDIWKPVEGVQITITNHILWVNVDGLCRLRIKGNFKKAPDGGSTNLFTIEDNRG